MDFSLTLNRATYRSSVPSETQPLTLGVGAAELMDSDLRAAMLLVSSLDGNEIGMHRSGGMRPDGSHAERTKPQETGNINTGD